MKRVTLKKTLIVLLFGLAVSCGSKDDGGNQVIDTIRPPINPANPVVSSVNLDELKSYVESKSFPEQTTYKYQEFIYNESTTVLKYIDFYRATEERFQRKFVRQKIKRGSEFEIVHEYGDNYNQIKKELINILNLAVDYKKLNNCLWEIRHRDFVRYGIDVCESMIANPTYKKVDAPNISKTEYELFELSP